MSFAHPARLVVALFLVAAFAVVSCVIERRKTQSALAYSNLPFLISALRAPAWILPALLTVLCAAAALVGAAFAGPHIRTWTLAGGHVFLCIDTSGSMASSDVEPTRGAAAAQAARAFIDAAAHDTKIGIVAFATAAAVVQGATKDREALYAALDAMPPPNGATAIGDALALARAQLPAAGHRAVILITDGVNNHGVDPMAVARDLGSHRIPVYTIGIGTHSGTLVPGTDVDATIDEDALRAYAQPGNGAYARASDAADLRRALQDLGRTATFEKNNVDAGTGFALIGAVLMLATFLAGMALGRYP